MRDVHCSVPLAHAHTASVLNKHRAAEHSSASRSNGIVTIGSLASCTRRARGSHAAAPQMAKGHHLGILHNREQEHVLL